MEIYTRSQARAKFFKLLEYVVEAHDPVYIFGKHKAVLIAEEDYRVMVEALYSASVPEPSISPGIVCTAPWRLTKVVAQPDYTLLVEFVDGTQGTVILRDLIMGEHAGVFAALQNIALFNQVYLAYGVATWPGELDLAPDVMHQYIKQQGVWRVK